MDLGDAILRKVGTNYLRQAIYADSKRFHRSRIELTWTDGRSVHVSTVDIARQDIYANEQLLGARSLGHESPILGAVWNRETVLNDRNCARLLAVFSNDRISVWSETDQCQMEAKAELNLVQEFAVENCSAQGCVWNPHPQEKLLAVVSRNRASVCRFEGLSRGAEKTTCNCFVTVFQAKSKLGHLQSCSWSSDGRCLLIGAGTKLVLCSWQDLSNLDTFAIHVWDSFNTHGNISGIAPVGVSSFVAITEVPIDKLCSLKPDEVSFDLPRLQNTCELPEDEDPTKELIVRKTSCKEEGSLLKLKCKSTEDCMVAQSQLMLINCSNEKPEKLCCELINGLMSPDLFTVEPLLKLAIVGSNSSNEIQLFSVSEGRKELRFLNKILLDPSRRPKGLCKVPDSSRGFLVIHGKQKREQLHNVLPAISLFEEYRISLEFFEFKKFLPNQMETNCVTVNEEIKRNNYSTKTDFTAGVEPVAGDEIHSLILPGGKVFEAGEGNVKPLVEEMNMLTDTPKDTTEMKAVNVKDLVNWLEDLKINVMNQLGKLDARLQNFEPPKECAPLKKCAVKFPTLDKAEFVSLVFTHSVTTDEWKETFLLGEWKTETQDCPGNFQCENCKTGYRRQYLHNLRRSEWLHSHSVCWWLNSEDNRAMTRLTRTLSRHNNEIYVQYELKLCTV